MNCHQVLSVRKITPETFVVRMERKHLPFQTGQFITVGDVRTGERREYSVYSGEQDDFLEILVREVQGGKVSGRLKKLKSGDQLEVDGPFGFFKFHPGMFAPPEFLFIATGTGISPFHSFVRTHPGMNYRLVHGVRYGSEAYDHADFDPQRVVLCTSGDDAGHYIGRVSDYLRTLQLKPATHCFLCGNSQMIGDVFDILTGKGIPVSNLYSEVYF